MELDEKQHKCASAPQQNFPLPEWKIQSGFQAKNIIMLRLWTMQLLQVFSK